MNKTTLAALVCVALLAGCAAMRTPTDYGQSSPRTAEQVVDDATITAQAKAALAADPELSALKINVDTSQGAVKLKGEIKTLTLRRKAESVVRAIKGVKSVDNQLIVTG